MPKFFQKNCEKKEENQNPRGITNCCFIKAIVFTVCLAENAAKLDERRNPAMAFPQSFMDELVARSDIVDVVGSYV